MQWERPFVGDPRAPIAIVCDAQSKAALAAGLPMARDQLKWFADQAVAMGFKKGDLAFYGLCPPIPEADLATDARAWRFVEPYAETLRDQMQAHSPKVIVALGSHAARAGIGRAVKITRARGVLTDGRAAPVLPMLSPGFIARLPEHKPAFIADLAALARLKDAGFKPSAITVEGKAYEWRDDLTGIAARVISVALQTTGRIWWHPSASVSSVQIATGPGRAYAFPIHPITFSRVFPDLTEVDRLAMVAQLKAMLEDAGVKKIAHDVKLAHHMLAKDGVEVRGWIHDTQLMAFFVDENIVSKDLASCVRLFVPDMAGYSDEAPAADNIRASEIDPAATLDMACADADATYRLARVLDDLTRQDPLQRNCYRRIQFPALLAFAKVVERYGIAVDRDHLTAFGGELEAFVAQEFKRLMRLVPVALRRKAVMAGERVEFSPDFLRKVLFSKDGFGLEPKVFTKSTTRLSGSERVPSVSINDHLPYFAEAPGDAGEFCRGLKDYVQAEKLLSTYVGRESQESGFWKYIAPDGAIYPSYLLHRTATGRTASEVPSGQNFPKRGRFAKAYNRIFKARPGFKLISADLSQIELRIVAVLSQDPVMLEIFRAGGDIHTATAINVMGMTEAEFRALPRAARRLARTKAKALNFGLIYDMTAATFAEYAKTDYGVDMSLEEAERWHARFFAVYAGLRAWHDKARAAVKRDGQVRALHGAVRHLPSIASSERYIRHETERQAINAPVQRLASDMGLMALTRFSYMAPADDMHIVGFVHDQIVMEVRDGREREALEALIFAMENQPLEEYFGVSPPVPIKAEADIGLNFGEMIELSELPPADQRPAWFEALRLPIEERAGVEVAAIEGVKPPWWRDEWSLAEREFLYDTPTRAPLMHFV